MHPVLYLCLFVFLTLTHAVCAITGFEAPPFDSVDAVLLVLVAFIRTDRFQNHFDLLAWPARVTEAAIVLYFCLLPSIHLSYAVQPFARPLRDDVFLAADRWLGFDYVGLMGWATSNDAFYRALSLVYQSLTFVSLAVFMIGLFCRRDERLAERYLTSFMIAVMAASIIGGLLPARGAVMLLDPASASLPAGATPYDVLMRLREVARFV